MLEGMYKGKVSRRVHCIYYKSNVGKDKWKYYICLELQRGQVISYILKMRKIYKKGVCWTLKTECRYKCTDNKRSSIRAYEEHEYLRRFSKNKNYIKIFKQEYL